MCTHTGVTEKTHVLVRMSAIMGGRPGLGGFMGLKVGYGLVVYGRATFQALSFSEP